MYCRTCDQWFHNLHNKREHLQGRQHIQSVAGAIRQELDQDAVNSGATSSTSLSVSFDDSSLDATTLKKNAGHFSMDSVSDAMKLLLTSVSSKFSYSVLRKIIIPVYILGRENEIKTLQRSFEEIKSNNEALYRQLCSLRERENKLKNDLELEKKRERDMEMKILNLWQVPNWFIITDLNTTTNNKNDT